MPSADTYKLMIRESYCFFVQQDFLQSALQDLSSEQHDFLQPSLQVFPLAQQVFAQVFEQPPAIVAHELKDIAANAATDIIDKFWITFFILSIFVLLTLAISSAACRTHKPILIV